MNYIQKWAMDHCVHTFLENAFHQGSACELLVGRAYHLAGPRPAHGGSETDLLEEQ